VFWKGWDKMIFQTLDDKNECVAIYQNGEINYNIIPQDTEQYSKTWSYSQYLKNKDIEYANLYCEGKTLDEVCPEEIKKDWQAVNKKLRAIMRSFIESKVSMNDNCFFDLTPERFLKDYCIVKEQICEHVFANYSRPHNYEFLRSMTELFTDIKYRKLNIDLDNLKENIKDESTKAIFQKYSDIEDTIEYNLFGAVTGRLSAKGFPILTFNKKHRHVLNPTNDFFVEMDFNAAEIRMAYALSGKEQPKGDVYEEINNTVYDGELTRKQVKDKTIVWLYDEEGKDNRLESVFDKKKLLDTYYKNGYIHTAYGRKIEVEERKAISYLLQSSFIDLFHRQVLKVHDYIKYEKTFIPFMIHDCLYLDMSMSDRKYMNHIVSIFSDTEFGKYLVSVKAGKKLSEMKELKLNG